MRKRKRAKKLNSIYYKTIGISMLIFIGIIALAGIFYPDKEYSSSEKRNLEAFPDISLASIVDGSFMKNFEDYISDQIISRDIWVEINASLQSLFGKKESSGVYLCKDYYLMERFEEPDEAITSKIIASVNSFEKQYSECSMYFMLVPNACSIYPGLLPENALNADQKRYTHDFYGKLKNIQTIDIYNALSSNKTGTDIYYHTDHHWTTKGAYIAYKEFAKVCGFEFAAFDFYEVTDSFSGSLSSKSGYKRSVKDSISIAVPKVKQSYIVTYETEKKKTATCYNLDSINEDDKYQLFFGGNHPQITIDTDNHNGKKIIIFKDSYANCFIPFLLGDFEKITIIDPRYYYDDINDLMLKNNYTDVLFLYNVNTLASDNNLYEILGEKDNGRI